MPAKCSDLQSRVIAAEDIDTGLIDAVIAMSTDRVQRHPPFDRGAARTRAAADRRGLPPLMIRTRKKTIVPRSVPEPLYAEMVSNDDDLRRSAGGHRQDLSRGGTGLATDHASHGLSCLGRLSRPGAAGFLPAT